MKVIYKEGFEAPDMGAAIDVGSEKEHAVASLLNASGENSVEAWFVADTDFNATLTKVRNTASLDGVYDRTEISGFVPVHSLVEYSGLRALHTKFAYYKFNRKASTDWAVAVVCKLDPFLSDSANTSVIGGSSDTTGINKPSINFTKNGNIRVPADPGHGSFSVFPEALPNPTEQFNIIIVSQSPRNGVTCRVNGSAKTGTQSAKAKMQSQGNELTFLGSDVVSAAFNGQVFELLLLNEDISDDSYKVSTIEDYLFDKYSL